MSESEQNEEKKTGDVNEKPLRPLVGSNVYSSLNIKLPTKIIILAGAVAILLLFIGALITSIADSSGAYKAGAVLYNLGVMALGGTLFAGALTNDHLDANLKMGMMVAAGFILAVGFITSPI